LIASAYIALAESGLWSPQNALLTFDLQDAYKIIVLHNKVRSMTRKRAPGGGRKARSGPTSSLTFRIPDDLRRQLEFEATEGATVSERLLWHLRRSINRKREEDRDPPMKALCFVFAETAHQVVGVHILNEESNSEMPAFDWRWTPFFYRAFKLAVGQILDALEPKGEIKRPDIRLSTKAQSEWAKLEEKEGTDSAVSRFLRSWETPEARANYAADYILNYALRTIPHYSAKERAQARARLDSMNIPSAWREFYGMPDAARDLTVEPDTKRQRRTKSDD
jgi:hypothetical protein